MDHLSNQQIHHLTNPPSRPIRIDTEFKALQVCISLQFVYISSTSSRKRLYGISERLSAWKAPLA